MEGEEGGGGGKGGGQGQNGPPMGYKTGAISKGMAMVVEITECLTKWDDS